MKNDLDTKVRMVQNISVLMHRVDDDHMKADLYKLTNRSIEKLIRSLEAKDLQKIGGCFDAEKKE